MEQVQKSRKRMLVLGAAIVAVVAVGGACGDEETSAQVGAPAVQSAMQYGSVDAAERFLGVGDESSKIAVQQSAMQYGSVDAAERFLGVGDESSKIAIESPVEHYGSPDAAERWLGVAGSGQANSIQARGEHWLNGR